MRPARGCNRGYGAAALGGAEILQRLWAERIPQGRPALRRGSTACADPRNRARPSVPVREPRLPRRRPTARFCLGRRLCPHRAVGVEGAGLRNPASTTSVRGTARTFLDKAKIIFAEMGVAPNVEFIDLPAALRCKYQYYTCGSIEKLRSAGYTLPSTRLEDGLRLYVRNYLETSGCLPMSLRPIRQSEAAT